MYTVLKNSFSHDEWWHQHFISWGWEYSHFSFPCFVSLQRWGSPSWCGPPRWARSFWAAPCCPSRCGVFIGWWVLRALEFHGCGEVFFWTGELNSVFKHLGIPMLSLVTNQYSWMVDILCQCYLPVPSPSVGGFQESTEFQTKKVGICSWGKLPKLNGVFFLMMSFHWLNMVPSTMQVGCNVFVLVHPSLGRQAVGRLLPLLLHCWCLGSIFATDFYISITWSCNKKRRWRRLLGSNLLVAISILQFLWLCPLSAARGGIAA